MDIVDAKETSSLAAVTDDSCTAHFIERASDDYFKPEFIERVVEVKPEDLQDVKQEPADEDYNEATHYSVKVRFFQGWNCRGQLTPLHVYKRSFLSGNWL